MRISLAGTRARFDKSCPLPPSIENAGCMPETPIPRLTLVLGGARSGKSRYAEELVERVAPPWTYVATAEAFDDEMTERIAHHRRGATRTGKRSTRRAILPAPLAGLAGPALIDCLTLWLSNVMLARRRRRCRERTPARRARLGAGAAGRRFERGRAGARAGDAARACLSRRAGAPQSARRSGGRPRDLHGGRPASELEVEPLLNGAFDGVRLERDRRRRPGDARSATPGRPRPRPGSRRRRRRC